MIKIIDRKQIGGMWYEESQVLGMGYSVLFLHDDLYWISTQVEKKGGIIMFNFVEKMDTKKMGIFAAGVLFGTAGIKILSSKDAKKVYTNCTAAVLRAKDCVMKTATTMQENAEDIYAEAQQINEDRAMKETEAVYKDERKDSGNGSEQCCTDTND